MRATRPVHGQASWIHHDARGVFEGLPNPLQACRYHSLVVEGGSLPDELQVTAQTSDGIVMGIRHRQLPLVGLQFHPESVLTEQGYAILGNFLRLAGIKTPTPMPTFANEICVKPDDDRKLPDSPVTF